MEEVRDIKVREGPLERRDQFYVSGKLRWRTVYLCADGHWHPSIMEGEGYFPSRQAAEQAIRFAARLAVHEDAVVEPAAGNALALAFQNMKSC
jgi:hypothetical protein